MCVCIHLLPLCPPCLTVSCACGFTSLHAPLISQPHVRVGSRPSVPPSTLCVYQFAFLHVLPSGPDVHVGSCPSVPPPSLMAVCVCGFTSLSAHLGFCPFVSPTSRPVICLYSCLPHTSQTCVYRFASLCAPPASPTCVRICTPPLLVFQGLDSLTLVHSALLTPSVLVCVTGAARWLGDPVIVTPSLH